MPDGVVFLPSYHEAIKDFPDEDRLRMYDAIIRYGLCGEIMDLPPVLRSMFALIKPTIDASQNRHRAAKANGSKPPREGSNPRGRPGKNQTENQSKNQETDIEIDIDTEKEIDTDTEKERDTDTEKERDTGNEVSLSSRERQNRTAPQSFADYCAANGWKIGRNKMMDGNAAGRTWEKRDRPKDVTIPDRYRYEEGECL